MTRLFAFCAIICFTVVSFVSCNSEDKLPAEIKIVSEGQVIVEPAEGSVTVEYDILNPKSTGVLSVEITAGNDWIYDPVINEEAKTVTVTVAENLAKESRNEMLTLIYTYGEESVTALVNILQKESEYDYIEEGKNAALYYYGKGQLTDPELTLYYLFISTTVTLEKYTKIYYFALAHSVDTEDKLPLPGTYSMVPYGSEADFCFDDYNSYAQFVGKDIEGLKDLEEVDFAGGTGTVEVEKDGSYYTITADITDTKGRKHRLTYAGEL